MTHLGPYELNKVHLGDCIELMKAIEPNSIDFIFTDPPYGHNNNNGDMAENCEKIFKTRTDNKYGQPRPSNILRKKEEEFGIDSLRPIANDGHEANDLVRNFFTEAERVLKAGSCCCCCCGGGGPDPQFARWSLWLDEAFGGGFKHMVIWDKGPMGMGHHYRRSYETVLVAQKKGAACKWFADSKDIENIIRPNQFGASKIIPQSHQHPTEKPHELAGHFIRLHTQKGDIVLDAFSGSGSTGKAAIIGGRQFLGFEIDPRWCDLANKRIEAAKAQGVLNL